MKFFTTTLLTILPSILTPPTLALALSAPTPSTSLPARQAASARITNIATFTGTGCPSLASFTSTINPQANTITITFSNFNVIIPAASSTITATCNLGIQMAFPAGCLSLATTAQYALFGRFGRNVVGGVDSTYSVTAPGRIVGDDNSPQRFSGNQFIDGEAVGITERVGVRFNTSRLVLGVRFTLGVLDAITAGGGAAAGGNFQVRSVTWALGSQTRC